MGGSLQPEEGSHRYPIMLAPSIWTLASRTARIIFLSFICHPIYIAVFFMAAQADQDSVIQRNSSQWVCKRLGWTAFMAWLCCPGWGWGWRHCTHCLLTLLDNTILEETSLEKTQGNGKSFAAWGNLTKGRLTGTGRLGWQGGIQSDKWKDMAAREDNPECLQVSKKNGCSSASHSEQANRGGVAGVHVSTPCAGWMRAEPWGGRTDMVRSLRCEESRP